MLILGDWWSVIILGDWWKGSEFLVIGELTNLILVIGESCDPPPPPPPGVCVRGTSKKGGLDSYSY